MVQGGVSFHPSKEGFKAARSPRTRAAPARVSIPLRKVSRSAARRQGLLPERSFHPSKEGFKGDRELVQGREIRGFHPSKEGFKVKHKVKNLEKIIRFHPSKEGFKAPRVAHTKP